MNKWSLICSTFLGTINQNQLSLTANILVFEMVSSTNGKMCKQKKQILHNNSVININEIT